MNEKDELAGTLSNRLRRHISVAISLVNQYSGGEPFHLYLKKYFSANRKHGSRDRKIIIALCYGFFRIGKGLNTSFSKETQFLIGLFLTHPSMLEKETALHFNLQLHLTSTLQDRMNCVSEYVVTENLFPFNEFLSEEIDKKSFSLSFLQQPKLFLRIRPDKELKVTGKLAGAGIVYEKINRYSIAIANQEKLKDVLEQDKDAVVQDYNSQQTALLFPKELLNLKQPIAIWDCCAASGGKSILAFDNFKQVRLTVSDTRKNILDNCKKRFKAAGITHFDSFVTDLSKDEIPVLPNTSKFDLIIADVPCSGSGTWSRTPEHLFTFNKNEVKRYSLLQQSIVEKVINYLKPGGFLIFITCSVFRKENEENLSLIQNMGMNLKESQYFKGYKMQADTLFGALFQKR